MKTIILILLVACASCTATKSCPTYAAVPVTKPEPRFTNAEKTGLVLFGFFTIWATQQASE